MPQDAHHSSILLSTKPTSLTAAEPSARDAKPMGAGAFSVETYADRLMDDLFGDVEKALEMLVEQTRDSRPTAQERSESVSIPPLQPEPVEPPPNLSSVTEPVTPVAIQLQEHRLTEITAEPEATDLVPPELGDRPPRAYDRLLLALGCCSLVVTLGLWLLSQAPRQKLAPETALQTQSTQPSAEGSTPGFAQYLQRSLEAIERRTQPQKVALAPSTASNQSASSLPTVAVPGTPMNAPVQSAPTPAQAPPGVARVYVPNYPIPPNFFPNRAAGSPVLAPAPRQPQTLATSPAQGASPMLQQPVQAPTPLAVPGVVRTLRGLVEMGDRSAALIEINGIVQSFRLGESIGSSGWTLVEVSKERIIVRRNGELRSIAVEQSF